MHNISTPILLPSSKRKQLNLVRKLGQKLLTILGALVALLLLWQLWTTISPSTFFPSPLKILENSGRLFFTGPASNLFLTSAVTVDTFQSLWRLLLGFVLGSVAGVVIGTATGRSIALREFSDPIVEFLRSIPATATLPLFVILLGGEDSMRIAFIAYGVMWFVLINTAVGVSAIHATLLDMGAMFKIPRWKLLLRIVIPAALPKIFAGLRISLTGALLLSVVSEFMLATNGIGFQLVQAQTRFAITNMWSWMLLLAVLGFLLNSILEAIENRVLAWDRLARHSG